MSKLEKVVNLIGAVSLLWIILSYIDVISHNLSDYNYANWNLITIFSDLIR